MSTRITGIRQWCPESRCEPVVRIGVVLAGDAMPAIELRIPDAAFELVAAGAGGPASSGWGTDGRTVRSSRITARLTGTAIEVSVNDEAPQTAAAWSLAPRQPRPPTRGDGVFVRGVVAGRGFHWQKRVDQTLAGRIELLPGAGGIILVNELPLETYLAGVITSEMSSRCPAEFLRAQCITARSWLLAMTEPKHEAEPFDRCNDDCCQRYQGTGDLSDMAIDAVESTRGMVLIAPDGRVVDANYSKSCGGVVELPEHVWGVHKPGLGPQVDAPADSSARRFLPVTEEKLNEYLEGDWLHETDVYCSPRVVPEDRLGQYLGRVDMLRQKLPEQADMVRLADLRVTKRGISGRATEIVLAFVDRTGKPRELCVPDQYRIRQILHKSFLFSSAFAVRIELDAAGRCKAVALRGAGWGHGAGMCQIGALGMALCGIDHRRIVKHYFPEADLKALYGP
jgi:stage II sporulation protein D